MTSLAEMCALAEPAVGDARLLPGMVVHRAEAPTAAAGVVARPTLTLVLRGAKRVVVGERVIDYRAGECLVVTVDLPMSSRAVEAPLLAIGIPLRAGVVADLLRDAPPPAGERTAIGVSPIDGDLLDALGRLFRMRDRPGDLAALGGGIEREIHWRLLLGPQGRAVRELSGAGGRIDGVARAIGWIRAHVHEVLHADDVAKAARMSVPTLNRHFRAVTSLSPLQYQKTLRLHEARLRLVAGADDIDAVAYGVGYESRSQFSREYRRMFGLPPQDDRIVHAGDRIAL